MVVMRYVCSVVRLKVAITRLVPPPPFVVEGREGSAKAELFADH